MKKSIIAALSLFILCTPLISIAHPGHGETDGYTIIHYFTEPMHAVLTYGILLSAAAYIYYNRRQKKQNENI
jgi:hypothetical protein